MKTIQLAILTMLLAATESSKADNSIDPVEAKLEALVKQSPKMNLPKLLEYNMKKLDAVYKAALKSAEDSDHRKALEESQKAWRAFFEADGSVAAWNAKGGSYAYPAQVEQRIYQVRMRIYQLTAPFMQGWPSVPRIANPEAEQAAPSNGDKPSN
jgi:uncharacterized protein YecT (DUF1311 family)